MHVLVTGGSGYVGGHIVAQLLERGHSVVAAVRSEAKANSLRERLPVPAQSGQLAFVFVPDFLKDGAFDEAVGSDPPLEAVIHTASPLPGGNTDVIKEVVEPAVSGTVGILHSTKNRAPSVKRVIITSSTASVLDPEKDLDYEYSEKDWNPYGFSDIGNNPFRACVTSKKIAERSAWEFLEKEKPRFTISTIVPPWVFGPMLFPAPTLSAVNASNQWSIVKAVTGNFPSPGPSASMWVDVRDLALAHVLAIEETPTGRAVAAANKRIFVVAGAYTNREVIDIIASEWPGYMKDKLPGINLDTVDADPGPRKCDNSVSREVLGLEYTSLRDSVVDTVKNLPGLDL